MGNDLISRSILMQSLKGNVLVDVTSNLEQAIAEQPAAYDMDKVVEQLENDTEVAHKRYMDCNSDTPAVEYAIRGTQYQERRKCLDIVRSGERK